MLDIMFDIMIDIMFDIMFDIMIDIMFDIMFDIMIDIMIDIMLDIMFDIMIDIMVDIMIDIMLDIMFDIMFDIMVDIMVDMTLYNGVKVVNCSLPTTSEGSPCNFMALTMKTSLFMSTTIVMVIAVEMMMMVMMAEVVLVMMMMMAMMIMIMIMIIVSLDIRRSYEIPYQLFQDHGMHLITRLNFSTDVGFKTLIYAPPLVGGRWSIRFEAGWSLGGGGGGSRWFPRYEWVWCLQDDIRRLRIKINVEFSLTVICGLIKNGLMFVQVDECVMAVVMMVMMLMMMMVVLAMMPAFPERMEEVCDAGWEKMKTWKLFQ